MGDMIEMNSIKIVPRSDSSSSSSTKSVSSIPNTQLNLQDAWLPITASRNGNLFSTTFHLLNSGIGIQALSLPVAFIVLGWTWGLVWLSLAFAWQLFTTWLLIQLHESVSGTRYSRYLHLSKVAFGERPGKLLALFPTMYLSGGTCANLVLTAGRTIKLFIEIVCGPTTCKSGLLTTIEWYLVFVILAIIIAQTQRPNLNSVAWISLVGAITAFTYCTLVWVMSITLSRPTDVSYNPVEASSPIAKAFDIFNALGIVVLVFRGHNLVLEIQGTLPSSVEQPSRVIMWRAVKFAYVIIALCLYPLAIAVYWAYGNKIQHAIGMMPSALHKIHGQDHTSRIVLSIACLIIVINSLSSFQIYAMPSFDNLTLAYVSRKGRPCPPWVRSGLRVLFGCVVFFVPVALPFISNIAGLVGGIVLPVTLAYPCFMWIAIKKPKRWSVMWTINCILGSLGIVISVLVFAGGVYTLVNPGIYVRFFKP